MLSLSLRCGIVLLALGCAVLLSHAGEMALPQPGAAVQERLLAISASLRCLVCQGGSLYDSHTVLAQDLRREIQAMIEQGKTDQEIRDTLLGRYGDFLLDEAPGLAESVGWTAIVVLLLAGAGVLLYRRANGRAGVPARRY